MGQWEVLRKTTRSLSNRFSASQTWDIGLIIISCLLLLIIEVVLHLQQLPWHIFFRDKRQMVSTALTMISFRAQTW